MIDMSATAKSLADPVHHHIQTFQDSLDLSDRSIRNYTSCVKRFYRLTGRDQPIDPNNLENISTSRLAEELSEHINSQSMKYGMLKYFDWLQERAPSVESERTILFFRHKIENKSPKSQSRDIGEKVLSSEKCKEIIRTAPKEVNDRPEDGRLLLRMMYDTATRISGMIWLEWQDVWREEYAGEALGPNELLIHRDRSKSETSGIVELEPETLNLLQAYEDRVTPSNAHANVFFPEMTERSVYQKIYRCFKTAAEKCGVPDASTHWFRHSRLTHLGVGMLDDGKDYAQIKERLRQYGRHKQAETTEIYISILKQKRTESISKYSPISWEDTDA